jgi:hypothetical protein
MKNSWFEDLKYFLNDYLEMDKKRMRDTCSDCGFWIACDKCSVRYSQMDKELRKSEGKGEFSDYFFPN